MPAVFRFVRDTYGPLSNMAPGYPVFAGDVLCRSTEHLYQALRFPEHPDIQKAVLGAETPIAAKQTAYKYLSQTRSDWDTVKVKIMYGSCLLKYIQHQDVLHPLLRGTGEEDIIEHSVRDDFWGAKPINGEWVGRNILGRIWMRIRNDHVQPPDRIELPDMGLLLGIPIPGEYQSESEDTPSLW